MRLEPERRRPPAASCAALGPFDRRGSAARRASKEGTGEEAEALSPTSSARPIRFELEERSGEGLGLQRVRCVTFRDERGEFGFERSAFASRQRAAAELGPQFVDLIDEGHDVRLRLDDVDGRRAREGRVKDRAATGGAGERGRRFCRLARQNWGDRSSLRRAEQPYDRTSSRGENRGPEGRVRMPAAAGQSGSRTGAKSARSRAAAAAPLRSRAVRVAWRTPVFSRAIRRRECI